MRTTTALLAATLILVNIGCGPEMKLPAQATATQSYEIELAATSAASPPEEKICIVHVKDKRTGKVYVLAFHDGFHAESMVKIDEWMEPTLPTSKVVTPGTPSGVQ